ncbi:MAG TPA: response regulator transcription factor [Vicinamibacterales bacterium]|jgi:DNA-binding NarL/FixJ family response regulator
MTLPRVLLADDHAIVAEGLRLLLKDHCELVGVVSDGPSMVEAALQHRPEVIVADISMPGFDGLQAVRRLRELEITARIIMLTMYADLEVAEEAIAAGANGYVVKHSAGEELLKAITAVREGLTYITPFLYKARRT